MEILFSLSLNINQISVPQSLFRAAVIPFNETLITGNDISQDKRHRLPKRHAKCDFCKALMWDDERLSNSTKNKPKFGVCCLQGQVELPPLRTMPQELYSLLTQNTSECKEFRTTIRLYNSILAFTSISANVDQDLMTARNGIYTYRINGSIHHKISSYMPNPEHRPQFSQIYIYDSQMQSSIRAGMFPKIIRSEILNTIQRLLELHNPYVRIYMQAGETLRKDPSREFNIVLKSSVTNDRTKNLPTSNEIAVLMVDDDQINNNKRDIVIKKRNGSDEHNLQYINENLHFYDPLAYPLMHIFGEKGWQYKNYKKRSKDLLIKQYQAIKVLETFEQINSTTQIDHDLPESFFDFLDHDFNENNQNENEFDDERLVEGETNSKYISAREFYSYRLQDREGIYLINLYNYISTVEIKYLKSPFCGKNSQNSN